VARTKSDTEYVDTGTRIPDLASLTQAEEDAETAAQNANDAASAADTARLALQDTIDTQVNAAGYPYTATGASVAVHPVKDSRIDFVEHIAPVQAGSGDPSPSNVRPITAPESVSVTRFGENLLMPFTKAETVNGVTFTPNDDGSVSYSGTPSAANIACSSTRFSSIVIWLEAGTYTLSGNGAGGLNVNEIYICPYGGSTILARAYTGSNDATFTISERMRVEYILRANSNATVGTAISGKFWPKLELGSTATAFKPWTGYAVTVTLPSDTYGGKYDSKTGILTKTHGYFTVDGSQNPTGIKVMSNGQTQFYYYFPAMTHTRGVSYCDSLPQSYNMESGETSFYFHPSYLNSVRMCLPTSLVGTTAATIKSYLASNPIHFVFPLTTVETVNLGAQVLRAASPAQLNHVWTSNGTIEVSGATDLKWLIDSLHPNG
jgi:hypothetical protein